MRSSLFRAATLVLLLLAARAHPQEGAIGLEEIRARVLDRSAALRGALLSVDSSRLDEKIQSLSGLPSLSASAGGGLDYGLSPAEASYSASLGLKASLSLYDGGAARVEAAIAALNTEASRAEARAAYVEAIQAAEGAYYGYLEARASVAAAESALGAADTALELALAKREAGSLSLAELLSAQSLAAAKGSALSQARKGLSVAKASLDSLAGLSPGRPVADFDFAPYEALAKRLAGLSDAETEELSTKLLAFAAKENPDIARAALSLRIAEGGKDAAARKYAPKVSASYSHSFGYSERGGLSAGSGSLGLSASLALAPWSSKAGIDSAGLASAKASIAADEARRNLELALKTELYGLIAAARDMPSNALALEYAEKRREAVFELFRLSAASSTELSEAGAASESSRKALIAARFGFLGLLSDLRAETGAGDEAAFLALLP